VLSAENERVKNCHSLDILTAVDMLASQKTHELVVDLFAFVASNAFSFSVGIFRLCLFAPFYREMRQKEDNTSTQKIRFVVRVVILARCLTPRRLKVVHKDVKC